MPTAIPDDVRIRPAAATELLPVMRLLDGAMLDIERATVQTRIDTEDVYVAVRSSTDRVLGVIVVDTTHDARSRIEAIAVRSTVRDRDIGTALIERIDDGSTPIVAEFDASARPFYRSLGFAITSIDDGDRFRGRYDPSSN